MKALVYLIGICLYAAYFLGLYLCFHREAEYLRGRFYLKRRLADAGKKVPGKLEAKLSSLVFMAIGKQALGKETEALCAFLFILGYCVSSIHTGIFFSLITALLLASVPIISLVSIIQHQRNRSGKEGLVFTNSLYRQYVIGKGNMLTALEKVSEGKTEYPVCARQSYLLLLRLRSSEGKPDIRASVNDFSSAIGTLWAKNIGIAVMSALEGYDVSEALLDISRRLKHAKEDEEEKKRLNSEAKRMTLFLVPFMYLITFFMSLGSLGLTLKGFLRNQFGDPAGRMLFFSIVFLFAFDYGILSVTLGKSSDI